MRFWRIYHQPALNYDQKERAKEWTSLSIRIVDKPIPHIVCWDGTEDAVGELADFLKYRSLDVICIQRDEGQP